MCGINGIVRLDPEAPPPDRDELIRTREAMRARGPDGDGAWFSEDGDVAFAHRRLAIIDLSPAGTQPMVSADGRFVVTFNGEIYNYRDLKRELEQTGARFRSSSDTEVLLEAFARMGTAALARLRGMFALAIWDRRDRSLVLARDPYGIKPLYYAFDGRTLRFASQVRALAASGAIGTDLEPAGVTGFLRWGSVPEPWTWFRGVLAVPAGHLVEARRGAAPLTRAYAGFGVEEPNPRAEDPTSALEASVAAHLVADVPVAVFLSAGLDSSLIASLAARHSAAPLTTITMRFRSFEGGPWDESPVAAETARSLRARHREFTVDATSVPDLWERVVAVMDQPSVDGFNSWLVARAAKEEGFKVVLSGAGGDELFGSYASFRSVPRLVRWSRWTRWARPLARAWRPLARRLAPHRPKLEELVGLPAEPASAYTLVRGLFLDREIEAMTGRTFARAGFESYDAVADAARFLDVETRRDDFRTVHVMESTQYLRNQLLRDADWASMAHSVELRLPLVDWPLRETLRAGSFEPARSGGKIAAVRRAAPGLPASVWSRPKSGFYIPILDWIDPGAPERAVGAAATRRLALRVARAFGLSGMSPEHEAPQ